MSFALTPGFMQGLSCQHYIAAALAKTGMMHNVSLKCSGCIDQVTKHDDEVALNGYAMSN